MVDCPGIAEVAAVDAARVGVEVGRGRVDADGRRSKSADLLLQVVLVVLLDDDITADRANRLGLRCYRSLRMCVVAQNFISKQSTY